MVTVLPCMLALLALMVSFVPLIPAALAVLLALLPFLLSVLAFMEAMLTLYVAVAGTASRSAVLGVNISMGDRCQSFLAFSLYVLRTPLGIWFDILA